MTAPVLVLVHNAWEGPGLIGDAVEAAGLALVVRNLIDRPEDDLPGVAELAGVVLMGGPMGATDHDAHPGLVREADLVRAAVDGGLPVLGVCLGHQIIATALGADLHAGATHEVGLASVRFTDAASRPELGLPAGEVRVLHWHGDNVDAPDGAVVLGASAGCPVQALAVGSALGLQFHPELTPAMLDRWLEEPEMRADLAGPGEDADVAAAALHTAFAEEHPAIAARFSPVFASFARRCANARQEAATADTPPGGTVTGRPRPAPGR
ncbi:type 1 glutamine amidotransferase [Tersicoccus sp. MR15.9]|uniref:type 1 glutamine amidotransferase n=1 Tax=Tersicoccus mangrovi TaxID=3121635 RepID=UPI002FE55FC9